MKIKEFDCVEMKQLGSQKVYEEIKDLSLQDELLYWQEASKQLRNVKDKTKR
jgi:hypothetical protein